MFVVNVASSFETHAPLAPLAADFEHAQNHGLGSMMSAAPPGRSWEHELLEMLKTERGFLLRLARVQLHDAQWADDVVQEAILSAWQSVGQFEGRSSLRTWLVGILRFKILDALRDQKRQPVNLSALELSEELKGLEDDLLFDAQGQWLEMPQLWGDTEKDPSETLHHKQGLQLLKLCLQQLPEKTAQVFLMREYLGFDGSEVAQQTGLQAGHVRVILMRARLALRTCLELRMAGTAVAEVA